MESDLQQKTFHEKFDLHIITQISTFFLERTYF